MSGEIRGVAADGEGVKDAPMGRRERLAWALLLLASLAVHLWGLTDRPFHHDESVHGWFATRLIWDGEYRYDPVYHGPVQYFALASSFLLLGDSDLSARLPAALGGVALSALALGLRRRWGARAAWATGALVAASPLVLYYTRFCREDVWSLLGTAGGFLFLDAWISRSSSSSLSPSRDGRRLRDLVLSALFFALAFSSKENFYVLLALMPPSLVAVVAEPGRGLDLRRRLARTLDFLSEHATAIAGAVLLFFTVSELCYTLFLVHPDAGNPAWEAVRYWWGQHKQERIAGPKWYYLPRLAQYEFAILVPATAWALTRWRSLDAAARFCFGWGVSSIAMYAWLGEKTPWLMVHQLLPFLPLAGAAWASLAGTGRLPLPRRLAVGVATSVAAASLVTAWSLSFWRPALSPRYREAESAVYVQTAPEVLDLVREVEALARRQEERTKGKGNAADGESGKPVASVEGAAGWPLSWYFRRLPVSWESPKPGGSPPPIVVVDGAEADETGRILGSGWERQEIPLRAWWLPTVEASPMRPTPGEAARYLLTRVPWNPIGWQSVVVFRRVGENRGAS